MSGHLQSAASSGHLLYGGYGHLANECPGFSSTCTDCLETQPDCTVTSDGSGTCEVDGDYVFTSYSIPVAGRCDWEWRCAAQDTKLIVGHTPADGKWFSYINSTLAPWTLYGAAGGGGKDITSEVDCDGSGVIDHLVAAPYTLDGTTTYCPGDEAEVTLNP